MNLHLDLRITIQTYYRIDGALRSHANHAMFVLGLSIFFIVMASPRRAQQNSHFRWMMFLAAEASGNSEAGVGGLESDRVKRPV